MAMKEWGMNEKNNILSPSLKMICLDAERTGLWQDGRGGGWGSSGSHWKGLCHVLEVSRVSFRSYIQIVTVMNSVISGTLVQVKSMKKSHSFPTEAFRLQVSYSGSTGGLYRNLLDYRHKNRQMKKDISLLKITVWIKYIFTVSLEKYEINCNTQK